MAALTNWVYIAQRKLAPALRGSALVVTVLIVGNLAIQLYTWLTAGSTSDNWDLTIIACSFTLTGALIYRVRPDNVVGLLFLGMGTVGSVGAFASAGTAFGSVGEQIVFSIWWLAYSPLAIVFLLLPNGRPPSTRWRPWLGLATVGVILPVVGSVVIAITDPAAMTGSPTTNVIARMGRLINLIGIFAATIALGAGIASLLFRLRSSASKDRSMLRWLLLLGIAAPISLLFDALRVPGSWPLGILTVPLVMLFAALRFHLLDLDLVVDRTLVWLGSTVFIVGCFVGLLWLASAAVGTTQPAITGPVVLATVAAAVVISPVRSRIQRGLTRALYGRRDEPSEAFTLVDEDLSGDDVKAVLDSAVAAVARILALPYVQISVLSDVGELVTAGYGRPAGQKETIQLVHRGQPIGFASVTARSQRETLSKKEQRIIEALARTTAVTVRAIELAGSLQVAREGLIHAREDERLRLRRDLHDGVGPALVGARMQVFSMQRDLTDNLLKAKLDTLEDDLAGCVDEVSRVVESLRPPALDDGLGNAVASMATRLFKDGPALSLEIERLGHIPAAVEVTAYRIAAEALSNVVRHAHAEHCWLHLARSGPSILLEVSDDGVGPFWKSAACGTGVGLPSMHARAEELGGQCVIDARVEGGTTVAVMVPVRTRGGPA
jgi:signal transduction histidine kinase